ncbi:restriction endonuclease subunit S [Lactiplantibacillus plantarum]|uniref:restriction endonuclease subunit S n=1 Tax=Lactiplantibacillus plantarum TaxID=1590 RepID=UPI000C7F1D6E|nr:restriction endonuclease subunit S [Lactiplantibacillus plantarum]
MFPQNGSKIPELRFKGFADPWEQRKLGAISDIYDGTHQTPIYKNTGIPFLNVENIRTLRTNKFISREDFKKSFKIFPHKGDILMTRIGDVGTTNIIKDNTPVAYYVSLALLHPHKYCDALFSKNLIESENVSREIWKKALHVAFPKKINKVDIGKIPVLLPSKTEQQKEGLCLEYLDKIIAANQRKVEKLKELKKGYMQKMFC